MMVRVITILDCKHNIIVEIKKGSIHILIFNDLLYIPLFDTFSKEQIDELEDTLDMYQIFLEN